MVKTYNFPDHIKGDTFNELTFTIMVNTVALDLTGAAIKMDLKINNSESSPIVKTFSTDDNSIVIVTPASGIFKIAKQIIDIPAGTYVYDIQITLQNLEIYTYIKGKWSIVQDVTTNG